MGFVRKITGQQDAINVGNEQAGELERAGAGFAPFSEAGTEAIGQIRDLMTPQGQTAFLEGNPLLQQAQQQATNVLLARNAARGKLGSGQSQVDLATALTDVNQNALNQQFNRLGGVANTGLSAVGGRAGLLSDAANARAQGAAGAANIKSGLFNSAVQLGTGALTGGLGGGLLGSFGGSALGRFGGGRLGSSAFTPSGGFVATGGMGSPFT